MENPLNDFVEENPVGTKDAIHIPIVVCKSKDKDRTPIRGEPVRFVDMENFIVEPCGMEESHGIADPLSPYIYSPFCVVLHKWVVSPVRHSFEIASGKLLQLTDELAERRREDPGCAGCWVIEDGKVIRY